MRKGKELFERLNDLPGIEVREFDHGSNIFPLAFAPEVDTDKVVETLHRKDVFLYTDEGTDRISRLTVNTTILRQSNDAIFEAFRDALEGASSTPSVRRDPANS